MILTGSGMMLGAAAVMAGGGAVMVRVPLTRLTE